MKARGLMIDRRKMFKGAAASFGLAFGGGAVSARAASGEIVDAARRIVRANAQRIDHADRAALVDFSLPSWKPRFHVVDLRSSEVWSYLVAHGRGSDPGHSGWLQRFSNEIGSYATSDGAYRTDEIYSGKYGEAMRLSGLDADNSNARARAIVIHSAWYVGPQMIAKYGKLGRSEGCFAFSGEDRKDVIAKLGAGRLLYAGKF